MHRAGLKKWFLPMSYDDGATMFCYVEKGTKVPYQPSIVFIHGFSSDKYTWLDMIKVSHYSLLYKSKYLFIHSISLMVFTVSQSICLAMEKASDLKKITS
jgi:hypothetical protein